MKITFTVPAVPVPQPRERVCAFSGRDGRPRAQSYTPTKAPVNAFKAAVQVAFSSAYDGPPLDGPIAITLLFVLPRPKGMMWKQKAMPREWRDQRPDADNLTKTVMDALNGVAWRDDAQVCSSKADKVIAAGDERPHAEVTIEHVTWAPPQPASEGIDLLDSPTERPE